MADTPERNGQPENPSVHYEPSDVNFRWLLILGIVALMLAPIIHGVVFWFFRSYENHEATAKESSFPLASSANQSLPPEPRLEQVDRLKREEKEYGRVAPAPTENALDSWTTEDKHYARIPIDRAMKLLLERNKFRVRKGGTEEKQAEAGLVGGGASSSGRMFRGKK
jgi:hypothetical protein